jgi:general nucleoside transport system permease protein
LSWFSILDAELFAAAVRMTTPILLAALGGLLCSRAGTVNIALEGFMLIGAFCAVAGSYYSGSWLIGVLAAVLVPGLIAWVYAVVTLKYRANTLVVGIAINLFAAGITTFLMRFFWGVKGSFIDPKIVPLPKWEIPLVKSIPFVGHVLSGHTPVVYVSFLIVVLTSLVLFHTPFGLRLRSVGEYIKAAESLGIKTGQMQYIAVIASGVLSGLAGSQLSLGLVTLFLINMTAGRGFVSVVAVILGQSVPYGVLGASILFGLAEGMTMRLQGLRLPSQFVLMLPYVVTIVAMVLLREKTKKVALPAEARKQVV